MAECYSNEHFGTFYLHEFVFRSALTRRSAFGSHQLGTPANAGSKRSRKPGRMSEQMKRAPHEHFGAIIVQLYWSRSAEEICVYVAYIVYWPEQIEGARNGQERVESRVSWRWSKGSAVC